MYRSFVRRLPVTENNYEGMRNREIFVIPLLDHTRSPAFRYDVRWRMPFSLLSTKWILDIFQPFLDLVQHTAKQVEDNDIFLISRSNNSWRWFVLHAIIVEKIWFRLQWHRFNQQRNYKHPSVTSWLRRHIFEYISIRSSSDVWEIPTCDWKTSCLGGAFEWSPKDAISSIWYPPCWWWIPGRF